MVASMDPDIEYKVTPNTFTGADEFLSFRSKDTSLVWSVDGFIQHYFRGQPTFQTGFSGAVSSSIAPRHFVGGIDRQWSVSFARKQSFARHPNLSGGRNRNDVLQQISSFDRDDDGTYYRYNGTKMVFINLIVPSGGNLHSIDAVGGGQVVAGFPVKTDGSFDLRFAEFCA